MAKREEIPELLPEEWSANVRVLRFLCIGREYSMPIVDFECGYSGLCFTNPIPRNHTDSEVLQCEYMVPPVCCLLSPVRTALQYWRWGGGRSSLQRSCLLFCFAWSLLTELYNQSDFDPEFIMLILPCETRIHCLYSCKIRHRNPLSCCCILPLLRGAYHQLTFCNCVIHIQPKNCTLTPYISMFLVFPALNKKINQMKVNWVYSWWYFWVCEPKSYYLRGQFYVL